MLEQFINLIRPWIDVAIYVLTGQGQTITSEDQIRDMEDTPANAERAIALWKKRGSRCVCFDCSGLIVWALMKLGLITTDMKADGIYDKCPKIAKADLKLGDFCFRINEVGNAHHVGVVLRIVDGIPWVTEAEGRDDGVVERPIDADPGYWERYASNIFLDAPSGGGGENMIICQKQAAYDDNAKAMHYGLARLGYDIGAVSLYGLYGSKTSLAVAKFQTDNGLPVNGDIFDDKCNQKMLMKLAALESSTGITQAMLDAEKAKTAEANAKYLTETQISAKWAASDSAKKAELVKVAGALDYLKSIQDKY
jgi:hypothetical protein